MYSMTEEFIGLEVSSFASLKVVAQAAKRYLKQDSKALIRIYFERREVRKFWSEEANSSGVRVGTVW